MFKLTELYNEVVDIDGTAENQRLAARPPGPRVPAGALHTTFLKLF